MKALSILTAMTVCSILSYGQTPSAKIEWTPTYCDVKAAAADSEEVEIIRESDLPEGGTMTTYLSDFIYANINEYGVTWAHDDKLATHIYWTDSDMAYVHNLSTMGDAWVPAYIDGDTLWVPNGANIMVSNNGTLYQLITAVVNMRTNTMEARTGIKFTMNSDRSEIVMEQSPDQNNVLGFYTMNLEGGKILQAFSKIKLTEFTDQAVSPSPEAEYKRFTYSALLGGYRDWENRSWIAFDGNDVYVQGLEWIHSEGWVKGAMMSDGSIRIPTGQFVGFSGNYPDYYFAGRYEGDFLDETAKVNDRSAFFLNPDETTGGYSMVDDECFICGKDKSWGFPVIKGNFTPFDVQPGTPLAADDLAWDSENGMFIFHIPMTDAEGNMLDSYLLRYAIYVNGQKHIFNDDNSPLFNETIEEMPANASYYIYSFDTQYMFGRNPDDIYALVIKTDDPIETVGVKLIYNVLGDERESDVSELYVKENSISLTPTDPPVPVAFFGLDGSRLERATGACIIRYSDGSVRKVITSEHN